MFLSTPGWTARRRHDQCGPRWSPAVFLGYELRLGGRPDASVRRFRNRLRDLRDGWRTGTVSRAEVEQRIWCLEAHAAHADTWRAVPRDVPGLLVRSRPPPAPGRGRPPVVRCRASGSWNNNPRNRARPTATATGSRNDNVGTASPRLRRARAGGPGPAHDETATAGLTAASRPTAGRLAMKREASLGSGVGSSTTRRAPTGYGSRITPGQATAAALWWCRVGPTGWTQIGVVSGAPATPSPVVGWAATPGGLAAPLGGALVAGLAILLVLSAGSSAMAQDRRLALVGNDGYMALSDLRSAGERRSGRWRRRWRTLVSRWRRWRTPRGHRWRGPWDGSGGAQRALVGVRFRMLGGAHVQEMRSAGFGACPSNVTPDPGPTTLRSKVSRRRR